MTLGPMTEATMKVSRAVPAMAGALDDLVTELCGRHVLWILFAFTDGRSTYVSSVRNMAEQNELMGYFRRWLTHMEAAERGQPVPQGWIPESDEAARSLAFALRDIAKELESVVDQIAGEHVHIALVAFPQGVGQYASNGERDGVLKALREWLDFKDAGGEDVPAHNFM